MKQRLMSQVEESLNALFNEKKRKTNQSEILSKCRIDLTESLQKYPESESLYDMICRYMRRMRKPCFVDKNGHLDEPGFYTYARILKDTWSSIRLNKKKPSKETLLKLVFALQLNLREAKELLNKASCSLTDTEMRDRVVMALIDIKCYEIEDVYDVLEEYGTNGAAPFPNIYKI